ncbi:RsmG family class I SAM-dependent methyltransferase [Deinococcus maricopensis]|uniref:Ribosomal RNA small subunit methyltransferase G n=1 Tax=Deinococcus maricopensis (strain DSM 21211 / LMG 22137 / NRRL B-23946 / LB-34) TaxID=709986 RepID=E8U4R2_DEIML|nr:RsmG family class I SAM-dependent methyltransferase [Deinococcus maricopensis]ADV68927.1 glucose inhibited division protein [Deinococcus maricopensis DSM 21211]
MNNPSYEALVRQYAPALDLFGPAVLRDWARHEATAMKYAARLPAGAHLLDVGSGGGLPGIVIARERPDVHVTLCERRERRATFLKLAVARLGLTNADVFAGDVRDWRGQTNWVSAQAVADVDDLIGLLQGVTTDTWTLLTRRARAWYPPAHRMGYTITAAREALDDAHDLVELHLTRTGNGDPNA